jgi:hypothetical protein
MFTYPKSEEAAPKPLLPLRVAGMAVVIITYCMTAEVVYDPRAVGWYASL